MKTVRSLEITAFTYKFTRRYYFHFLRCNKIFLSYRHMFNFINIYLGVP